METKATYRKHLLSFTLQEGAASTSFYFPSCARGGTELDFKLYLNCVDFRNLDPTPITGRIYAFRYYFP